MPSRRETPEDAGRIMALERRMTILAGLIAQAESRYAAKVQDIIQAIAERGAREISEKLTGDPASGGIIMGDKPTGNLFSMRYRNDTERSGSEVPRYQGTSANLHQLEYINKTSPYDPEATVDNGVDTFWDDSLWTLVPGGDAVEIELEAP